MDDNFAFDIVALKNLAKLERLIAAYIEKNCGSGSFERNPPRAEAIEAIARGWHPDNPHP